MMPQVRTETRKVYRAAGRHFIAIVVSAELFLGVCCSVSNEQREPDAGASPYLRCLDLCERLEDSQLLCGESPRYPVSECASTCAEVFF